jgi:23S rRNA pseudouridine1911/1915/1917 synthase
MVVSAQGKEARTRYEVIETFEEPVPMALLEFRLETGRTHQIRVHMAAIGHAVVGDERYRGVRPSVTTPRMVLHSAQLSLDHPTMEGVRLTFESPLPADLAAVVESVRNP